MSVCEKQGATRAARQAERILLARGMRLTLRLMLFTTLAAACSSQPVPQPATRDTERGQALYQSACSACHTEQAHWREKRLVRDWQGLLHQVTRWQQLVGQKWSPEEVTAVAEYLNRRYYHLP